MIRVDPRDPQVVYAAAQGPLWAPGGDRGLYKSTDGGATWKAILTISENTGVSEVHFDPRNPDVLYASAYQRRRHVFTLINGGPESAIYKSTDAGATWRKVESGLPGVDKGRIGLAVSPANPDVIYAIVEAALDKSGVYRSIDRGETWEKRSDYVSQSPQYYNELFADPRDVDRVYSMDTWLHVTVDGGKTFKRVGERTKHVDNHAMWIDPGTPSTSWSAATAASTRAGIAAPTGTSRPTCRSPSSTGSRWTSRSRSTTSTAAPRTTRRRAVLRARRRRTASATATGSSSPAATATSRRSTRPTRTSSTASRSTAAWCATTGAAARRSTLSRRRARASRRCASTGTRR